MKTVNPHDITVTPNGRVQVASGTWVADFKTDDVGTTSINEGCNNIGNCSGTDNANCANDGRCTGARNTLGCVNHPV